MKTHLSLILIVLCLSVSFGQIPEKYKRLNWRMFHSLNWRDSVDYQSDDWKNMPIEEKNSLFQIPPDELRAMSTDELIEASIDCYFARRVGKYSTMQRYYKEVHDGFNGFRELTMRQVVGRGLIDYYQRINLQSGVSSPAGLPIKTQIQILEYLIASPEVCGLFKAEELGQLIRVLMQRYSQKGMMPEVFSERDMISNVYALATLLNQKDQETRKRIRGINQMEAFLSSGVFLTQEARSQIMRICKEM
jgi:hypothetical protein